MITNLFKIFKECLAKNGLIIAIIIILVLVGAYSYKFMPSGDPDNPLEEFCENIVEDHTGILLDFTPLSPE